MIRRLRRWGGAARNVLRGWWLYVRDPGYRRLSAEIKRCPECAPIGGHLCEPHAEAAASFFPP